jgi:hypothetical protein
LKRDEGVDRYWMFDGCWMGGERGKCVVKNIEHPTSNIDLKNGEAMKTHTQGVAIGLE